MAGIGIAAGVPALGVAASPVVAHRPVVTSAFDEVSVEDRLRIQDQMARYAWAFDAGDLELYLDRYWADGELRHPRRDGSPGSFKGHEGIIEFVRDGFANRRKQAWGHQHQIHTAVMRRLDEQHVQVDAYCTVLRHEFHRTYWPAGSSYRLGTWHATYRQQDADWKLALLDVRMWTDVSLGETGLDLLDRPAHAPGTR